MSGSPDTLTDEIREFLTAFFQPSIDEGEPDLYGWEIERLASALAAVGYSRSSPDSVFDEINAERLRAHAKHGATSMESCDRFADRRLRVLVEEVGEVAQVLNDREHNLDRFVDDSYPTMAAEQDLRSELVQVAAMAVAWIAAIDGHALAEVAA